MRKIAILSVAAMVVALSGCWTDQDGEKVGTIVKSSTHGFLPGCQSYEAELVRGGLNSGTGVMGAPFDFTVETPELKAQVDEALNNQTEVKVYYRHEKVTFCRSEDHKNFVYKIEPFVKK
jgi:hypothetical protein